jgi:purine-cytosine permease-like protein
MNFFKDGLSVNETKVSALIISFLITLGFAMWQVVKFGEISDNVLSLLSYLIMAVAGINITEKFSKKRNDYPDEMGN